MSRSPVTSAKVERIEGALREQTNDLVAVEEPLQIILEHGQGYARSETPLALTMRTPGHDRDLVTGFLYAERVIASVGDLMSVRHCRRSDTPENVVRAVLHEGVVVPRRLLERRLTMTSACGVCGARTAEGLWNDVRAAIPLETGAFEPSAVRRALASLETAQACFRHTGGTHGAALFDRSGRLVLHREDVGRHNALDKLVGAWLAHPTLDPMECFVVVSSRASFELVQKAVVAGFPMLIAMGAASSLAIETAQRFDLTLLGFAKMNRFNIYSGSKRIAGGEDELLFAEGGWR